MKEIEIKQLVRTEISDCFAELTRDIAEMKATQKKDIAEVKANQLTQAASLKRIENGLFGDTGLQIVGLAEKIEYSYDYARRNTESRLVARAEVALLEFSFFKDNRKVIAEIIEKYKITKAIAVLLVGSGVLSSVNLVTIIVQLLTK